MRRKDKPPSDQSYHARLHKKSANGGSQWSCLPGHPVRRGLERAALHGAFHHTNTWQTNLGRVGTLGNGALRLSIATDPGEPLRWIVPNVSGPLVERCPQSQA